MALGAVRGHHRVEFVQGKKRHRAFAFGSHAGNNRIGCIQNSRSFGAHVLNNHALEYGKFIDRGDVVQAEVITTAHIGDNGHIAAVKRQAFAQYPAACGFKYCSFHVRMVQHIFRTLGATAVTRINTCATHVHPIGIGHANAQTLVR